MDFERILLGAAVAAFAVYLYWLGRTVFGMAVAVGEIKKEIVGNGKDTAENKTEIDRIRKWKHEVSQTIQEHELRLDIHDEKLDRLMKT